MRTGLHEKAETKRWAQKWSAEVKRLYGPFCFLHRLKDPRSKVLGTQAAHIRKRSFIGSGAKVWHDGKKVPLAFIDARMGRPLCYDCHVKQELGTDPAYEFPLEVRIEFAVVHNIYASVKLPVPTE